MVTVSVADARRLCVAACHKLGLAAEDSEIITAHLLDAELRGVVGLSRLLALADDVARYGPPRVRPIAVLEESEHSALLDGGDRVGMVVGQHATELAIDKARRSGIAVVGANRHYYSGVLAYYAETAARAGLVAMIVAAGGVRKGLPRVAPYGARVGRFTTNPIAFGFPSADEPVVWDISTAASSGGELLKRLETGEQLPEGAAVDVDGAPTRDPRAAIDGALRTWGGHRGSGLAIAIQLLGLLCRLPPFPTDRDGTSFLILAIDPEALGDGERFRAGAAALAARVRASAPAEGFDAVRMPYDRSLQTRAQRLHGGVRLPAAVLRRLETVAAEGVSSPHDGGGSA